MHPFDKSVMFAKHAQHVALIHFPIALFIIGALIFLHIGPGGVCWPRRAYCNLFAAALTAIPVLITGILAWQWELEGQQLKGVLLLHLVFGVVSSVLIWIVWLIHLRSKRKQGAVLPGYRLPIEVVAVAIVAVTGYLGGFLTGKGEGK